MLLARAKHRVLSKLQCTGPSRRFGLFSAATLDYSIPLSSIVGLSESKSTSISIHGYVDLRRSIILCGKYSSIDLSSIDSNGIRSPCTWLPNTGADTPKYTNRVEEVQSVVG